MCCLGSLRFYGRCPANGCFQLFQDARLSLMGQSLKKLFALHSLSSAQAVHGSSGFHQPQQGNQIILAIYTVYEICRGEMFIY